MRTLFLSAAGLAAVGCSSSPTGTFVGQLEGTTSRVGVVLAEDRGLLYVCGGEQDLDRHHHWFELEPNGAGWIGTEADTVSLEISGDGLQGSVTVGGQADTLTATPAEGVDGLYEATEDTLSACRVGVVVADGGSVAQGAFCPDVTTAVQVVPIDFSALSAAGFAAQSDTEPPVELFVEPARP